MVSLSGLRSSSFSSCSSSAASSTCCSVSSESDLCSSSSSADSRTLVVREPSITESEGEGVCSSPPPIPCEVADDEANGDDAGAVKMAAGDGCQGSGAKVAFAATNGGLHVDSKVTPSDVAKTIVDKATKNDGTAKNGEEEEEARTPSPRFGVVLRSSSSGKPRNKMGVPVFVKSLPETKSVRPGGMAKLEVEMGGGPKPHVTWYKDGVEMYKDRRHMTMNGGDSVFSLLILNASAEDDDGLYTCRTSSLGGQAECACRLTIVAK